MTSPGHLITMKAQSRLIIDQWRTTLYGLFQYIGQCMFNSVFTLFT